MRSKEDLSVELWEDDSESAEQKFGFYEVEGVDVRRPLSELKSDELEKLQEALDVEADFYAHWRDWCDKRIEELEDAQPLRDWTVDELHKKEESDETT